MFGQLNPPPVFHHKSGKLKFRFQLTDHHYLYPMLVGLLLGILQTGLFFQLTLSVSSGFATYLMITLCWLAGSAIGVRFVSLSLVSSRFLLVLTILGYFIIGWMVHNYPFNTQLALVYASLIVLAGLYPGVFFVRLSETYTARMLFFWENNGFILGIFLATILFMILGRTSLMILSMGIACLVWCFDGLTSCQTS